MRIFAQISTDNPSIFVLAIHKEYSPPLVDPRTSWGYNKVEDEGVKLVR